MRYVGFSTSGEQRDYREIAKAAMHCGRATEVSADEYDYMLNVLPPIWISLGVPGGFLVMEATSSCSLGDVHAHYAKINGRYYGKWAVKGRRETYIDPRTIHTALPIDLDHARIAAEQNAY